MDLDGDVAVAEPPLECNGALSAPVLIEYVEDVGIRRGVEQFEDPWDVGGGDGLIPLVLAPWRDDRGGVPVVVPIDVEPADGIPPRAEMPAVAPRPAASRPVHVPTFPPSRSVLRPQRRRRA
jgi:hypothetical protein